MDNKGSPLSNLFRALPTHLDVVLFVWSAEAFSFALHHVRGPTTVASEECPMQSVMGNWALISAQGAAKKPKGVAQSLLGSGPYWVIVNMSCYVSQQSPLDLFTEAAVSIRDHVATRVVSVNTPEYALQQLRQYRGELPPTVEWLNDIGTVPEYLLRKPKRLAPWWITLLKGTQVDPWIVMSVAEEDFDPDFWFLPDVREPQEEEEEEKRRN